MSKPARTSCLPQKLVGHFACPFFPAPSETHSSSRVEYCLSAPIWWPPSTPRHMLWWSAGCAKRRAFSICYYLLVYFICCWDLLTNVHQLASGSPRFLRHHMKHARRLLTLESLLDASDMTSRYMSTAPFHGTFQPRVGNIKFSLEWWPWLKAHTSSLPTTGPIRQPHRDFPSRSSQKWMNALTSAALAISFS